MDTKDTNDKKDIWSEGVKSIMSSTKRSLLDFVDMIQPKTQEERENIGKIKGRIHNDLSSACLNIGTLFTIFRSGGDISPFRDIIVKKEHKK